MQFLKKLTPLKAPSLLCLLLAITLIFCSCSAPTDSASPSSETPAAPEITITAADTETDSETATHIRLDEIQGPCKITQAGSYLLSGATSQGVVVDAQEQVIHIILDCVTVDTAWGPALEIVSAGKVILSLPENSESTFRDSGAYPKDAQADACIYSNCDLTINGSGSLSVYGFFKDAIHTKDVLKILGGSCFIQSKRDGLHGNDGIVINQADITVQSERNGLFSTKTGKPGKGNVEIYNSICSVIGGHYAVSCAANLYIADCTMHAMGVYDRFSAAGTSYIAEGSLSDE